MFEANAGGALASEALVTENGPSSLFLLDGNVKSKDVIFSQDADILSRSAVVKDEGVLDT